MINSCTNAHFSSTPLLLYSVCYRALIFKTMNKEILEKANKLQEKINQLDKKFNCATKKTGYSLNIECQFKNENSSHTFYLDDEENEKVHSFLASLLLKKIQDAESEFNAL